MAPTTSTHRLCTCQLAVELPHSANGLRTGVPTVTLTHMSAEQTPRTCWAVWLAPPISVASALVCRASASSSDTSGARLAPSPASLPPAAPAPAPAPRPAPALTLEEGGRDEAPAAATVVAAITPGMRLQMSSSSASVRASSARIVAGSVRDCHRMPPTRQAPHRIRECAPYGQHERPKQARTATNDAAEDAMSTCEQCA